MRRSVTHKMRSGLDGKINSHREPYGFVLAHGNQIEVDGVGKSRLIGVPLDLLPRGGVLVSRIPPVT